MRRSICFMFLGLGIVLTSGCGDSTKAQTVDVKGTVVLDAQPMADGEVNFIVEGHSPVVMPVKDGAFSGKATVGKNHVDVRAFKTGPPLTTDPTNAPTKVNFIPDRFNGPNSTLTAEVTAAGPNDFKFEVASR